ncbi:MBL fold metallo-hydrolase [[Mycobacterium] burgundiense]|uniref:Alkyl sulfatase dimerization domain-containing protein n=1 Tax=[Mycobacterium] burgundiense TaxID=3064286 RepID=A0ABN9NRJ8_9MYCO|nr:alkyl sulfatase dimerization domain-containing protein [Mycolicibacterium sp. MU0053]CAJ1510776.1 alkyl sulfatase dimerization domain-containing protein [Mycolicibacterium sp. MU0053]
MTDDGLHDFAPLHRSRPGVEELAGASATEAQEVAPGIWMSPGLTNSYLLTTGDGRIVVNTGMGFEAPVHKANFDAVDDSPVRYIIYTQGHPDHVGGTDVFREPGTQVVAQANWEMWRDDTDRLLMHRARNTAFAFMDKISATVAGIQQRFGQVLPAQAVPNPDVIVDDILSLEVGSRKMQLIATPGGETTDSMVVWLPDERVCLCSNLFGPVFGHIPNLVTMRGDRYRDALTAVDSYERVRQLQPEALLTGHFEPIRGAARINAELIRLRDAVQYLHDETVAAMNAGDDVRDAMAQIVLPPHLEVGEGYGKVSWNVRAIWETYNGWFHRRSATELYSVGPESVSADVVELAGADALSERADRLLAAGEPLRAIHLGEIVLNADRAHPGARSVVKAAHEALLAQSTNFWESAWLRKQIGELS